MKVSRVNDVWRTRERPTKGPRVGFSCCFQDLGADENFDLFSVWLLFKEEGRLCRRSGFSTACC
jgi:hypothetical protein